MATKEKTTAMYDWECPLDGRRNSAGTTECARCGSPKPGNLRLAAEAGGTPRFVVTKVTVTPGLSGKWLVLWTVIAILAVGFIEASLPARGGGVMVALAFTVVLLKLMLPKVNSIRVENGPPEVNLYEVALPEPASTEEASSERRTVDVPAPNADNLDVPPFLRPRTS